MMVKQRKMCLLQLATCLVLLFAAWGCDDHEPRPEPQPVAAVNGRLLLASSFIYGLDNAQYNADKRPKSFNLANTYDVTVTYTANSATYTRKVKGLVSNIRVFELENNVAKKVVEYDVDSNGKQTETRVTKYSYKGGKLSRVDFFQNGMLQTYGIYTYDSSYENLLEANFYDQNGIVTDKWTYGYTNIPDKSVLFNEWDYSMEGTLFPKMSKYLIQSRSTEENGSVVESSTFTYTLDGQGYVTAVKETRAGGQIIAGLTFGNSRSHSHLQSKSSKSRPSPGFIFSGKLPDLSRG